VIKNIITPGSNTGELAILLEAGKRKVTTGGFVMKIEHQSTGVRTRDYKGQANCDRDNLRVADLTVVIVVDDPRPAGTNRVKRLWEKRNCRNVVRTFIDGEQTSIVHDCLRLGVEVLNFVSIQHNHDCPEATRKLKRFVAAFIEEASQIVETEAPAIWIDADRFKALRKRKIPAGAVRNFILTNDRRFLPGVAQTARNEIFQFVVDLPIDQSLKRKIIDEATDELEAKFDQIAIHVRQKNWFNETWQKFAMKAVREHVKKLPKRRRVDLEALTGQLLTQWRPVESASHGENDFLRMCEIAANTSLRQDRLLRTLVLLYLGGISQSKVASGIVRRLMTAHQRINHDFSRTELNQRLKTVGGWNAVIAVGKANRYDRLQDPFLEIAKRRDARLEAELFYMADEFRQRKEFWDPKWLAAFCHSLCLLCGEDETLWRSWVGPPMPLK
jgi:hypothetical protein